MHTATAQVQVWDFNPSVSPTSATVKAGGSANFTVTVSPVNGFVGTLNLYCSSSTALVACAFNPTSITVPASGTGTSTLTLTDNSHLGLREENRPKSFLVALVVGLALPPGIVVAVGRNKRRTKLRLLLFSIVFVVSCGGGSSTIGGSGNGGGGGGGGGNSQTYSITVQVGVPNGTYTKATGTIKLTVN
jgi:hypothetical protein